MKRFEDEVEFKKDLDKLGVRYGDLDNTWKFYVEFVDNKGASLISYSMARTPIGALRSIPELLKNAKLPIDDLDVIVRFAFKLDGESYDVKTINSVISPYMYFKKEKQIESNSENSSSPEVSE